MTEQNVIPYRGVLIDANKTFDETLQYDLLREELAELMIAVSRYQRGRDDVETVIEEAADVRLLCDQIAITERYETDYKRYLEADIERLRERVRSGDINE